MKMLVVYYSRHGHTRTVAKSVAKHLKADIEELIDMKDRSHLANWFTGAFDEELRIDTQIVEPTDPSSYDLVIIGTPIWDGIVPPVRAYISKFKFKKVAFFITFGGMPEDAAYVMSQKVKKRPLAVLELQDREIELGAEKKIREFCRKLK